MQDLLVETEDGGRSVPASAQSSNPADTLMQIAGGWLLPRSLHLIADLGVADAVDLSSCDAYMLMDIIHDWDDEKSADILRAVRAAAPDHAKLLLLETIVPDEDGPHWAKTLDVLMLAVTGGLQRTAEEYEALLARTGFQMEQVIETPTGISIVEAAA